MTGVKNTGRKKIMKPEHVKPERLGGCLACRVPYLESRWVRFVFRLLLSSVVALLILNAVAGKVEQWQETIRLQQLSQVQAELAQAYDLESRVADSGSLTDRLEALQLQYTLLGELEQLSPAMAQNNRQQDIQQKIDELDAQIATEYNQAVADWSRVENGIQAIEVMQSFTRLDEYADAARWVSLCRVYIHTDIGRQLFYGNRLTAWVENYRYCQKVYPGKAEQLPVSFAAIRGSWMCREDQLELMEQQELSQGEGRAGIRCLKASGQQLMGGIANSFPIYPQEIAFDEVVKQGGVSSVECDTQAFENADPASCRLIVSEKSGAVSEDLSAIRVLSENVIVIEEGEWKGTYYRILDCA